MRLDCPALVRSRWQTVPLRWAVPIAGGLAAAAATGTLYAVHAQPHLIALVVLGMCVAVGWFLGQHWDVLRETAITDALTGVANRRHFDQELHRAVAQAGRGRTALSLLFVDIDALKAINDRHGHAAGDAALCLVSESLAKTCRSRDLVARWGGDEFAVLARWTTHREALVLAHRIRRTLAQLTRTAVAFPRPTVSIGIADLSQAGAASADGLLAAADDALYLAKRTGRDRVTVATPTARRKRNRPLMRLPARPLPLAIDPDLPRR